MIISRIKRVYRLLISLSLLLFNVLFVLFMFRMSAGEYSILQIYSVLGIIVISFGCGYLELHVLTVRLIISERYFIEKAWSGIGAVIDLKDIRSIRTYNTKRRNKVLKFLFNNSIVICGEKPLYAVNVLFDDQDRIVREISKAVELKSGSLDIDLTKQM